ncbi:MAG: hypothetical protein IJW86_03180 [Clostridia bacterium]|nr:hypothetical protein [Clostridia bacterium]
MQSKTKRTFYTEAAYAVGIILLALGTAFMERADFGLSMIVAPAYILHVKLSQYFSFFTFGMAKYVFQAFLILIVVLIRRRFKLGYLFSFVTAVIYGFVLDGAISLVSLVPFGGTMPWRIVYFLSGMLMCSMGVSLFFHTYISPEAYELLVKEVAEKYNFPISKTKTAYDCSSLVLSIALSFAFFGFGHFEAINVGTFICAVANGFLIGRASIVFEKFFEFKDALPMRNFFEK